MCDNAACVPNDSHGVMMDEQLLLRLSRLHHIGATVSRETLESRGQAKQWGRRKRGGRDEGKEGKGNGREPGVDGLEEEESLVLARSWDRFLLGHRSAPGFRGANCPSSDLLDSHPPLALLSSLLLGNRLT